MLIALTFSFFLTTIRAEQPDAISVFEMDEETRQTVLDRINFLRSSPGRVCYADLPHNVDKGRGPPCPPDLPAAKRMLKLEYNRPLEKFAKLVAEACTTRVTLERPEVHVSLYARDSSNRTPFVAAEATTYLIWAVDSFYNKNLWRYPFLCHGRICDRMFQLLYDRATHVGCAVAKCVRFKGLDVKPDDSSMVLAACAFTPKFTPGILPYEQGEQECPSKYPVAKDGLCSKS